MVAQLPNWLSATWAMSCPNGRTSAVGLKLYERVKKGAKLVPDIEEQKLGMHQSAYKFIGEYWNDELRNYRFSLKSRCIEETAQ